MREAGVDKIVFSSTCATYGTPAQVPIRETMPQLPVNPYGETKLAIERALHWYGEAYGLRWVSLRYFNAAGADPEGEIGETARARDAPDPARSGGGARQTGRRSTSSAPIIRRPTARRSATTSMSRISPRRICARSTSRAGRQSAALNLGTGRGHSVREVIAAAEAVSGSTMPAARRARRPGDPPVLVADPGLAAELLGWRAALSDLDTIIRTALAWHVSRSAQSRRAERNCMIARYASAAPLAGWLPLQACLELPT